MSWPLWSLADVLASRPRIRVNQLGYLRDGPKRATMVCDAVDSQPFTVVAPEGAVVLAGRSQPWPARRERTSGQLVHVLDFSDLSSVGTGWRLVADGATSHPFPIGDGLFDDVREDALRFFYLMRSGCPIDDALVPGYGRPAGHVGRAPNGGDTAVAAWAGPDAARLYPGWHQPGTFDVSGGWYDAGDYGKYITSGAIAVWQVLSALEVLARQPAGAEPSRLRDRIVSECRWQLDWLLRMMVPDGHGLAGMVFHRVHGTEWSPMPGWAHEDPTTRVLHRPSTPATLQVAAVTAQAARLLQPVDPPYSDRLLSAARTAYAAAERHPVLLPPDDHALFGGGPYGDDDVCDDRYWAASELWLATKEGPYLADLLASPLHGSDPFDPAGYDGNQVSAPARLDLALSGQDLPDHGRVVESVRNGADSLRRLQAEHPWGQPSAPSSGWEWGSNGRLLNNLVVLGVAQLVTGDTHYRDAVVEGLDYLFGRNALGQCYVTGYGTDSSTHLRTRQFGHDLDPAMPPPPPGAVVGGANSTPSPDFPYDPRLIGLPPQCCYLDEPTSEVTNDVCIRWNAPLVWVTSYLGARPSTG